MLADMRLRQFFLLPPESSSRLHHEQTFRASRTDAKHVGDASRNDKGENYSPCQCEL